MANAQVQVVNDAGTLLIDDTYTNLALRAKGTGTPDTSGLSNPIVAYGAGGTWYAFDVPANPGTNGGLVLYNAAGQCTFDAMQQYARVVDVLTGTAAPTSSETHTYASGRTYATAILKPSLTTSTVITPTTPTGYYTYHHHFVSVTASVNGNVVTIARDEKDDQESPPTQTPPNSTVTWGDWTVAVLDVTGY